MARGIPRGRAPPPPPPPLSSRAGPAEPPASAGERPAPALPARRQPASLAGSAAKAAAAAGSQRPLAGPRGSARHCGTAGEAAPSLPHPRPAAGGVTRHGRSPPAPQPRPSSGGNPGTAPETGEGEAGGKAVPRALRGDAPRSQPHLGAVWSRPCFMCLVFFFGISKNNFSPPTARDACPVQARPSAAGWGKAQPRSHLLKDPQGRIPEGEKKIKINRTHPSQKLTQSAS